jgi:hypothetical protein
MKITLKYQNFRLKNRNLRSFFAKLKSYQPINLENNIAKPLLCSNLRLLENSAH